MNQFRDCLLLFFRHLGITGQTDSPFKQHSAYILFPGFDKLAFFKDRLVMHWFPYMSGFYILLFQQLNNVFRCDVWQFLFSTDIVSHNFIDGVLCTPDMCTLITRRTIDEPYLQRPARTEVYLITVLPQRDNIVQFYIIAI